MHFDTDGEDHLDVDFASCCFPRGGVASAAHVRAHEGSFLQKFVQYFLTIHSAYEVTQAA